MKKFAKLHPIAALLLACYAGGMLLFLASALLGFAQNRAAYASGKLAPARLTLADFDLNDDLVMRDGVLVSVGNDPQLLLKDTERWVENVSITATYSLDPVILNAFWATPGQDHSLRHMAYRQQGTQAGATFWLPTLGAQSLRLDLGTMAGNQIELQEITINQKRPFYAFFIPSAGQIALLASLPGLVASGLWLLKESGVFRRGKAGGGHG